MTDFTFDGASGIAVRLVVDIVRGILPKIDGRWVHLAVVALSVLAAVATTLAGYGVNPHNAVQFGLKAINIALWAIGSKEVTRASMRPVGL